MLSCPSGANVSWSRAPPPNCNDDDLPLLCRSLLHDKKGLPPIRADPSASPAVLRRRKQCMIKTEGSKRWT